MRRRQEISAQFCERGKRANDEYFPAEPLTDFNVDAVPKERNERIVLIGRRRGEIKKNDCRDPDFVTVIGKEIGRFVRRAQPQRAMRSTSIQANAAPPTLGIAAALQKGLPELRNLPRLHFAEIGSGLCPL